MTEEDIEKAKTAAYSLCGVPLYKHNPLCPVCYPETDKEKHKSVVQIFKELYGEKNGY